MKVEDILIETPMDIDDIDGHFLNDVQQNRDFYRVLVGKKWKKSIETLSPNAIVYKDRSQYFCLDRELKLVTYYMTYEVNNNSKIGDYVWQSLVWTNDTVPYIRYYPQKIFFKDLLPKFGTIMTDSKQTWNGKRFWRYRIQDAFNMNLNVYFYNFDGHVIVKMNDMNDFRQAQSNYDIWGGTNKHLMKRMLLTTKELPINNKKVYR